MKTKLLLTTLFSLLLLGCTSQPSIADSNSTVVSSSSSSTDISKGETSSSSSSASISKGETSSFSSTSSSSFSSTGSSNSETSEKLDYSSLNNLLSQAIKLKERVHFSSESKGDLLIAEDANEVDENKSFVTLNMVKLLDESIIYCEPVEKFTSKQKIKEAEGILSYAIFSFLPEQGKKKNISLDELNSLIETAEEKLSSVKYLPDDEGEIIIAENASEVLNTTYFVTSKMYQDLSDSVNSCFPLDKFDNQTDIDQACNKIINALNYFVVERGTKTEKSIDDIVNDLKSGINKNVISYKRGEEDHAIIWNKEMIPPSREKGKDDFKTETYGDYLYEFVTPDKGNFYYDVNKKEQSGIDRLMCYAAVSANQLHFFFKANETNIQKYLNYLEKNNLNEEKRNIISSFVDSYHGQNSSHIYHDVFISMFSSLSYAHNADVVNDFVLNGYPLPTKENAEGFMNIDNSLTAPSSLKYSSLFYEVFKGKKLTERKNAGDYDNLSNNIIQAMKEGKILSLVHTTSGLNTHIVTVYGAEVDINNNLVALYVTDSDNTDESYSYQALERKLIKNSQGAAKLSINTKDINHGATITSLITLDTGKALFSNFFTENNIN